MKPLELSEIHLDITDPAPMLEFYIDRLGMRLKSQKASSDESTTVYTMGFARGADTVLRHSHSTHNINVAAPIENSVYWKIGITLPDVTLARNKLIEGGIAVTEPCQFHDIGYLCHLDDPEGNCIELLQHTFEQTSVLKQPPSALPLGQLATLGQVSLNVRDIDSSLAFYRSELGLRLLSRQEVPGRSFTLFFLADTKDALPHHSIDAVQNREWLWQRPYTLLELRAGNDFQALQAHPPNDCPGFRGISFSGSNRVGQLEDPDGVVIKFT